LQGEEEDVLKRPKNIFSFDGVRRTAWQCLENKFALVEELHVSFKEGFQPFPPIISFSLPKPRHFNQGHQYIWDLSKRQQ
jgi:hypothetical protein